MKDRKVSLLDRRGFLNWASAIGLTAIAPITMVDIADAKERNRGTDPIPDERKGNPDTDLQLTHPLEYENISNRVEVGSKEGDPKRFQNDALNEYLERTQSDATVDIIVTTIGEKADITTKGVHNRTIFGWHPSSNEVRRLQDFGSITHVPEFLTTNVSMINVRPQDIDKIAQLPFVLEITHDPELEFGHLSSESHEGLNIYDLRSWRNFDFQTANYSIREVYV